MGGPATADQQRTIRIGILSRPEFPPSNMKNFMLNTLITFYKDLVYPTDASDEPDATIRALNAQMQTWIDANISPADFTDAPFLLQFNYDELATSLFIDNQGDVSNPPTIIVHTPSDWDLYLNNDSIGTVLDTSTGSKLKSYAFGSEADSSNVDLARPDDILGTKYESWSRENTFKVPNWINEMDDLCFDQELIIFGVSCPTGNHIPDQPNNITVNGFDHDSVALLLGEPICFGDNPVTSYRIWRRPAGTNNDTELAPHTDTTDLRYFDNTVLPETAYEYSHAAVNADGESDRSQFIAVTTLEDPGGNTDPPEDLLDFLDDIFGQISITLTGIFDNITGIGNDKLFEMKMLEVLLAGVSDLEIGNLDVQAANTLELSKQMKLKADSATAPDIGA